MEKAVIYQDNTSTIQLEKNGRRSSGKRTKHMDIRNFYVKNKVDSGEIEIQYCPTKEMWGDYFTKPLQGQLFKKMRDKTMGTMNVTSNPDNDHDGSVLKLNLKSEPMNVTNYKAVATGESENSDAHMTGMPMDIGATEKYATEQDSIRNNEENMKEIQQQHNKETKIRARKMIEDVDTKQDLVEYSEEPKIDMTVRKKARHEVLKGDLMSNHDDVGMNEVEDTMHNKQGNSFS